MPPYRTFLHFEPRPSRPAGPSEDAIVAAEPVDEDGWPLALACADGVGSRPQAAEAARAACDAFLDALADGAQPHAAVAAAHNRVHVDTQGRTTLVGAVVAQDGAATVVWCGDSRAWHVRGDSARQVTHDHNVPGDLLRRGLITPEEAAVHPWANRLLCCLGSGSFEGAEVVELQLEPGDLLLLCSDGCNPAGPPVGLDPADPAADYVRRARAAGTHDDAAAIALLRRPES